LEHGTFFVDLCIKIFVRKVALTLTTRHCSNHSCEGTITS
jgi:hypothetical protein